MSHHSVEQPISEAKLRSPFKNIITYKKTENPIWYQDLKSFLMIIEF
jgi:hypothetical protein